MLELVEHMLKVVNLWRILQDNSTLGLLGFYGTLSKEQNLSLRVCSYCMAEHERQSMTIFRGEKAK